MMLTEGLIVRHNVVPSPREGTGIAAACSAPRIDGRAYLGIGIIQCIVVCQVEVEAGLELQPLHRSHFKESTSRKLIPHTLGFVIGQGSRQIPVGHRAGRTVGPEIINAVSLRVQFIRAVNIHLVHRIEVGHQASGINHIAGLGIGRNRIVLHRVGIAHIHASTQPTGYFTGNVGAQVETLVTGLKRNAFVVQIAGREIVLVGLSASGDIHPYFRTQGLLFHFFLPVHIPKRNSSVNQFAVCAHRLRIAGSVRIWAATHQLAHQIFRSLRCGCLRSIFVRIQSILIAQRLPVKLKILVSANAVVIAYGAVGASETGFDADRSFRIGLSLLSGYDNHPIRPAGAVKSSRSSILQNRQ